VGEVITKTKTLALDRVVWSIKDEGKFCMVDKAASRHTARGVDAGTEPEVGVTWKMVQMNEPFVDTWF
jgi:hypothetical protein